MTPTPPPPTNASTALNPAAVSEIIGPNLLRAATPNDAIEGIQPSLVAEPTTTEQVAKILAWANTNGLKVAPRGGGTRLTWGNTPISIDLVLSTARLNRLIEHAAGDMTVTVEAGLSLAALQAELAKAGQTLMLDAPFADRATIGGLIAVNDSGSLRLRYGGIRDLILGITFVRADGVIAHGGGKVVKNVAGYDMPKLMTGAYGTLGVITQATLRLHPMPSAERTIEVELNDLDTANGLMLAILDSTLVPTGLALHTGADRAISVLVRFAGLPTSVSVQSDQLRALVERHGGSSRNVDGAESVNKWSELGRRPWSSNFSHDEPQRMIPGGDGSTDGQAEPAFTSAATSPDHSRQSRPPFHGRADGSSDGAAALVLRLSVLPTDIGAMAAAVRETFDDVADSVGMVIHGHGLGTARVDLNRPHDSDAVAAGIGTLRERLAKRDGTAVVLAAPSGIKRRIDVFGPVGDALPLMRRIKAELDPSGTLNVGRFVGGI